MALIQDKVSVRGTSVIAKTDSVLVALSLKDFKILCQNYPEFNERI